MFNKTIKCAQIFNANNCELEVEGYGDDGDDNDETICEWSLMSNVPTAKCVSLTLLETLLSSCENVPPLYRTTSPTTLPHAGLVLQVVMCTEDACSRCALRL